jgi:hypothetical protein
VCDVKHDGCHKACFIDDGNLTDVLVESLYSELLHFMVYKWSPSLQSLMGWTCEPQTLVMLTSRLTWPRN